MRKQPLPRPMVTYPLVRLISAKVLNLRCGGLRFHPETKPYSKVARRWVAIRWYRIVKLRYVWTFTESRFLKGFVMLKRRRKIIKYNPFQGPRISTLS